MIRPISPTLFTLLALALITLSPTVSAQGPMPQASAEHKYFEDEIGTWNAESKFWMAPNTEPMVTTAVETNKMLGKMWMVSEYKSEMMGQPFLGRGQFGYDPIKKKYVGTWIDSMTPYLSVMEGTLDEKTQTLTLMSEGINMMTGEKEVSKMVSKIDDKDHKHFIAYGLVPGTEDQWWKKMEIRYTRQK